MCRERKSERNNSVELLRCAMMFLIVLHHVCLFYAHGDGLGVRACSAVTAFSTDAFAFISGWYGIRFRRGKVLQLLGAGLYASVAVWVLGLCFLDDSSFRYSLGWFGNSYLALVLCIPLVNAAVESLSRERRAFAFAYACYSGAMLLSWLPEVSGFYLRSRGWSGHSFNTLLFLYVTGRFLKSSECIRVKSIWLFWLFWGAMIGHVVFSACVACVSPKSAWSILAQMRDFNSPCLMCAAVCIVIVFARTHVFDCLGCLPRLFAPSMFAVYLLHEGSNPVVSRALYGKFGAGEGFGGCLITSGLVFFMCVTIDFMRRIVVSIILRWWDLRDVLNTIKLSKCVAVDRRE